MIAAVCRARRRGGLAVTADTRPHAVRFGLLAHLCFKLKERQGCGSLLVHPRQGEAVLYVPYTERQGRLGVAAVDHRGRWLYAFGDQWNVAGDVAGTAAAIAWAVGLR
ncbi:hypothetical protein [Actinomadura rugatobispora]|uniref:Uncharacterized protein n=1 Tax=Actinomadura rugatobispora TaxID=1994 RepID=A0ABW0ZSG9_9ACTN|nr:hypothetical protein GCM10010200_024430 [Actinomadura rugatobispora]